MPYESSQENAECPGRPLKVLISAYACQPGRGSEPGVGWNCVRQIARFNEVWAITRANNRDPIEKALAKEPLPNVHWIYFDLPRWASFWKKDQRGIHLYYPLWQLGAYILARKLVREIRFDLVHHVTFVNYWMPSLLALLPVPFLWGPVGGGDSPPRAFWPSYSLRGKVYEVMRRLARATSELNPLLRLVARRAALGVATTEETAARLRQLGCRRTIVYPGVGLACEEIYRLGCFGVRAGPVFRVVSIGRLLHLKGFEFALRAFARFQSRFPAAEYWIIGDGPERKRLASVAELLGVEGRVIFWGNIPRQEVLEKLSDCDVLVHPSLYDSGGSVSLEAMAAGRPVICLDLAGPALQVTSETGMKIPAISPEQSVHDLAVAMERLASDPDLRARMARAGRVRVQHLFNWEKKREYLAALYAELVTTKRPEGAQAA